MALGTRLLSNRSISFIRCSVGVGQRQWTLWGKSSGRTLSTAASSDDVDNGTANIVLIGAGWWSQVSCDFAWTCAVDEDRVVKNLGGSAPVATFVKQSAARDMYESPPTQS